MTKTKTLKARMLKDPEVRKAYDDLAPEFALAAELIRARKKAKLTQAQVARRMKTKQPMVARMESGKGWPSMSTISRYAEAVGAQPFLTLKTVRKPRATRRRAGTRAAA